MKRLVVLLAVMIFCGCASSVSNEATGLSGTNIINNPSLHKKVSLLDHHSRYTNGLLEAMVRLHNNTKSFQDIEYRFTWLDKDGFVVAQEPWQPLTLNGLETKEVSSIASSPQVVDFKFEFRPKQ